ncbi:hypothetical protein [Mycolicibacterium palauense]|uniref:hypothetical protein n=1 Tax=Mycolicibacterium palauense TaxID=2034511 RepID=UPI0011457F6C|nr:hypothetical protein [Mycolicibacterium palauense]
MKIRTDTGQRRAHINVKDRRDGRPGLVISQSGHTVLLSKAEWLAVREQADSILGTQGENQ